MRYVILIVCCVTFFMWDTYMNDGHAIYVTVREIHRIGAFFGL